MNSLAGRFDIFLGHADGAIGVDGPSEFGADVRIGDGLDSIVEDVGIRESIHPKLPVVATHDFHGVGDFLFGGGSDGDFLDFAFIGVKGFVGVVATGGFENGFENLTAIRVGATGRGQTVNNEVYFAAHLVFDDLDGLCFQFVGEGVAIEAFGEEAFRVCGFFKSSGVVPSSASGTFFGTGFLKKQTEGLCAGGEGRDNAGGEAVSSGSTDDQDAFRAVVDRAFGFYVVDLFLNVRCATVRMRSGANEAANFWFDDHGILRRAIVLSSAGMPSPSSVFSVLVVFRHPSRRLAVLTIPLHWARTIAGLILATSFAYGESVLIPFGAMWKYLDDGSDQGSAWAQENFDDSAWASGLAELGYGEDEVTSVGFGGDGRNKFITTYFRRTFLIDDPSVLPGIKLELLRDDGAVLYVNGVEVGRSNMPTDIPITKDTPASLPQLGGDEAIIHEFIVSPLLLNSGENTVAVEVHQDKPGSSDMSFDLRATDVVGPTAPMIQRSWLAASTGESNISITPQHLRATDFTSDDAELEFRISGLESGRFELLSDPGVAITEFSQAQIDDGEIQFVYEPGQFGAGVAVGNLAEPTRLSEISGLVASIQNPDVLWAHEDSDRPNTLIALGTDGSNRGEWMLTGATNNDWEDIGAATVNGEALLYIGDFGDNDAERTDLNILRISEPLLLDNSGGTIPETDIEKIDFQYPEAPAGEDGPGEPGEPARRDAESLIVDPFSGDIYILSKRETVGRLFRLAHQESYTGVQTLEYLGEMPAIIHDDLYGFSVSSTAADISRDGLEIIVRNYEHVMYFRRPDLTMSISDLLTGNVIEELPFVGATSPGGEQYGEAICFSPSADAFFTIGERAFGATEVPLFRYRRLPPNSPPAFSITVSDGVLESGPHPATILFNAERMEIWRHQHFGTEELADSELESSLWGDFADGDGDGNNTLVEYALGTDPRSALVEDEGISIERDGDMVTLTYRKLRDRTDVHYQVQTSMDLTSWTDVADEWVETLVEFEIRRVSIPVISGVEKYLRLKFSR